MEVHKLSEKYDFHLRIGMKLIFIQLLTYLKNSSNHGTTALSVFIIFMYLFYQNKQKRQ
jgi:hypothetical protein